MATTTITNLQIGNIATSKLLGRTTAGTGVAEQVTLDPDSTMAANSDIIVPTQKAVKSAIAAISGGGLTQAQVLNLTTLLLL